MTKSTTLFCFSSTKFIPLSSKKKKNFVFCFLFFKSVYEIGFWVIFNRVAKEKYLEKDHNKLWKLLFFFLPTTTLDQFGIQSESEVFGSNWSLMETLSEKYFRTNNTGRVHPHFLSCILVRIFFSF